MHLAPVSDQNSLYHQNIRSKRFYHSTNLFHMLFDQPDTCRLSLHTISCCIIDRTEDHLLFVLMEKIQYPFQVFQRIFRYAFFLKLSDIDQK